MASTKKRKYELKARAKRQDETRQRIVQATMDLHEEVGPARTTVAEIARRAGVQRLTVYNHFPEDSDLFAACSGHFLAAHPPPSFDDLGEIADPATRVRTALERLYGWYRETEPMNTNIRRDRMLMPAVENQARKTIDPAMEQLTGALTAGFGARGKRVDRLRATIAVAVDFWTWLRLKDQGFDDAGAAQLMAEAAMAAA